MKGQPHWIAKSLRNTKDGLKNYWICHNKDCIGPCCQLLPLDKDPIGCSGVRNGIAC